MDTKHGCERNLLPFSVSLFKLHLNHAAVLTPDPLHLATDVPRNAALFFPGGKYKGFENCDAPSLI
jgi:hypothetical protein